MSLLENTPVTSLSWLHDLTSTLVDVTLLIGAIVAVVKFRIYNIFSQKWRSELACTHCELPNGKILFTADYTVYNSGERPLHLGTVHLRLVAARVDGPLIAADETQVIAERALSPADPRMNGLFRIEAGERTIFPLRCLLDHLDDVVFVLCSFDAKQHRFPAPYRGIYCRHVRPTHGAADAAN
jgi:hypothetical protein